MKKIYGLFIAIILIMSTVFFFGCESKNINSETKANENIMKIKDFMVRTDSTNLNTSVKGSIFVKGAEGIPEHIQIVAHIEVDKDDWGGVVFYIPKKWQVSNIVSSYSANGSQATPEENIATFHTKAEKYDWYKFIEVGRNRNHIATGGTGSIVIDLIPIKNEIKQSEKYNITVAVGSDERNGVKIIETDSTSIEIQ